ncbi:zinc-ribbon domain-containing protein [Mycobacterium sp.]
MAPTRNGMLTATQARPASDKTVWWRCPRGHEWKGKFSRA